MSILLEFREVSKAFAVRWRRERLISWLAAGLTTAPERREIITSLSFSVSAGDIVAVVGPNGSGKSTLLRLAAGIYLPDSGEVEAHGALAPFLEPGAYFDGELSVRENIALCGALLRIAEAPEKDAAQLIDDSGVGVDETAQLRSLSPGMRARLAFSVLRRSNAEVLILDEFERSLDVAAKRHCCELLKQAVHQGKACLLATHDLDMIREIATRVLLFCRGRFQLFNSLNQALQAADEGFN